MNLNAPGYIPQCGGPISAPQQQQHPQQHPHQPPQQHPQQHSQHNTNNAGNSVSSNGNQGNNNSTNNHYASGMTGAGVGGVGVGGAGVGVGGVGGAGVCPGAGGGRNVRYLAQQSNAVAYGGYSNNNMRGVHTSSPAASSSHSTATEQLSSTNLYIRGLSTSTTDQNLRDKYQKFGKIISTKAIIDAQNGECRGYGFVDFDNSQDAELAIREMTNEGVQVQMAKQQEQDPTNLYIANLPLSVTDNDLKSICQPYGTVVSTRILCDKLRQSRGVGFVRMESKEMCEDIVKAFNQNFLTYPNLELVRIVDDDSGARELPLTVKFADHGNKKNTYRSRNYEHEQYNRMEQNMPGYNSQMHYNFNMATPTHNHNLNQGIQLHHNMMQPHQYFISPQMLPPFEQLAQSFNQMQLQNHTDPQQTVNTIPVPFVTFQGQRSLNMMEDANNEIDGHYSGHNNSYIQK